MLYRVIEGGYWRHGSLHIESDTSFFISDSEGLELYRDFFNYLMENKDKFHKTYTTNFWPEFFGIYPHTSGIIDVMVGEESSMWFVPQTHPHFESPTPPEGITESWLHGEITDEYYPFEDLYPGEGELVETA